MPTERPAPLELRGTRALPVPQDLRETLDLPDPPAARAVRAARVVPQGLSVPQELKETPALRARQAPPDPLVQSVKAAVACSPLSR